MLFEAAAPVVVHDKYRRNRVFELPAEFQVTLVDPATTYDYSRPDLGSQFFQLSSIIRFSMVEPDPGNLLKMKRRFRVHGPANHVHLGSRIYQFPAAREEIVCDLGV